MQEYDLDDLFAAFRASDAPGCVVAVARGGRTIYRKAFGLANVEQGVANSTATRMPIASVTKQFTCAAILFLEADGTLSIDDPVGRWLPDLPSAQRAVTLRQLMTHTGGVRCYLDHSVLNGYASMPPGVADRIQWRQDTLNFEPGKGSAYSNGGYLLLTRVIERASGEAFGDALRQRLFGPAGMRSTTVQRSRWPVETGVATTYLAVPVEQGGGWRHGLTLTDELFGDGGAVSTVDDLLCWAQFLRGAQTAASLSALADTGLDSVDGVSTYRYGLIEENYRGIALLHHAGGLPGSSSTLLMARDDDIDIVILCNRPAPAVDLSLKILERLVGERMAAEQRSPRAADYAELLGEYLCNETGLLLGFSELQNGHLGLSVQGSRAFELQSLPNAVDGMPIGADVGTGTMRFRKAGDPDAIDFFDGGVWYTARRLRREPQDARAVVASAPDEYFSVSAAARLRFEAEGDRLFVKTCGEYGAARYPAESLAPALMRFWPTLFPGGVLVRLEGERGAPDRLIVSTTRTRRIVFEPKSSY